MTATANIATESTGRRMLVPNGALRFEPEKEDEAGGVQLGNEDFGLEREEERGDDRRRQPPDTSMSSRPTARSTRSRSSPGRATGATPWSPRASSSRA